MVVWHHQFNGHELEQAPGVGDGQGSLTCCSPWGCKESDTTEQLNWTEQAGLRKGRVTSDQITNVRRIIKKARQFQKQHLLCFIDYAKAFDCMDSSKLWKILKEMQIPDHLTCILRNLYVGREKTVRTWHGTMYWFKIGTGICQSCILSPCLFNFYVEYIMWNTMLDKSQAEV